MTTSIDQRRHMSVVSFESQFTCIGDRDEAQSVMTSNARSLRCCHRHRNLHWDKEVAVENIVVKVTERHRRTKLASRDPSVRIGPLPLNR